MEKEQHGIKELQALAEFLRNVAYADEQTHNIDWSISVVVPSNDKGNLIFACGIWTSTRNPKEAKYRSMRFIFEENVGIRDLQQWNGGGEIYNADKKLPFEILQNKIINFFGVDKLYQPKQKA